MSETAKQIPGAPRAALAKAALAATALCLALLAFASVASADYEQVPEHFGEGGEAAQLEEALGVAVNERGEGGVAAGSIYVVGFNNRVVRFTPGEEGEAPRFEEAWGWGIAKKANNEFVNAYVRCGPAYDETADETHTFKHCRPAPSGGIASFGGEEIGNFESPSAVAVNEATGEVYVRNSARGNRENNMIEVFTARGVPVGEGFGEAAKVAESIAETPGKVHRAVESAAGIAVDEAGTVYLNDSDYEAAVPRQARIMCFRPQSPGDYEHYEYCGENHDIRMTFGQAPARIALAGGGQLAVANSEGVREYDIESGAQICNLPVTGTIQAMTANRASGEVFYFTLSDRRIHRLGPCDSEAEGFAALQAAVKPAPESRKIFALAVNPDGLWSAERPEGVLYAADRENGIGDVLAAAKVFPPAIEAETVAGATTSSATLRARIDPRGSASEYSFQYLSRAAYEANEPDERQTLTVSATGGLFGLGFEGRGLGGEFHAHLTNGSKAAEGLFTAKGTADLKAAAGTATLSGAVGKGSLFAGSKTVVAVNATEGAFAAGQTISGEGIPAATKIESVSGSELTLSAEATKSGPNVPLRAGTALLTSVSTSEGAFEAGMRVSGEGIPAGTTIASVSGPELTLSAPITKPGTAVAISAGFTTLTGLSVSEGSFEAGMPIGGEGIPAGTTIEAVHPTSLELSRAPTKPGEGVEVSSAGPLPLAVGESVEGPGIAAGTKIEAIEAGKLTLSAPAEATAEADLRAGLPFDATTAEVQSALEGLQTIGAGDLSVSGGPGDEAGSQPYEVEFTGAFANTDLPELNADGSDLNGGSASVTVATAHDGGGGFAGGSEAPASPGQIPSGTPVTASAAVSGLSSETAYAFRAVASSHCNPEDPEKACQAHGAPAFFATYPTTAAGLPDGRVYELVSPPQKHGGEAFPADPEQNSCEYICKPTGASSGVVFPMQSAADGNSVSYMGYPFSLTEGAAVFNSYLSTRTATGWQTTAMSPALLATKGGLHLRYTPDLGADAILQPGPSLAEGAPEGYANIYLQSASEPGKLTPLIVSPPPHRGENGLQLSYAGASADATRQFFAANDALTPGTAFAPPAPEVEAGEFNLYEWHGGQLSLVNVLPGNNAVGAEASFASASLDGHGVSEDGRRAFFEVGGHVYVRVDGTQTLEVATGEFLAANAVGTRVLLKSGRLYALNAAGDAYEESADLTGGEGGFLGVAGASEDLSKIYFVDTAALASAPEAGSCASASPEEEEQEQEGRVPPGRGCNLYLYQVGAPTRFIATLVALDDNGAEGLEDWAASPASRTAEASPNGRYLAFGSKARLTGYDNVGPCGKVPTAEKGVSEIVDVSCREAFLYDSATGKLTCPSCKASGEAPLGPTTLRRIGAAKPWMYQSRYLTDSGRLFFDSQDRLSPRDVNGKVEDVYEAEPSGVGSCEREAGCVTLISPGTGSVDSNFLAMGETGADVFFTTRERLVPTDTDELIDLYDARIGGGFPSETETQRAECQGEACQPAPNPPAEVTPASAAFAGAGNLTPAPAKARGCPKGKRKVKRRGKTRCVKRAHRKRHRGHKRHRSHKKRHANPNRRAHR